MTEDRLEQRRDQDGADAAISERAQERDEARVQAESCGTWCEIG